MAGFIGSRAKKRRRKIIIFFALSTVFILFYFMLPLFQLTETIPSDTLFPSQNETISPDIQLTVEELKFKVLDRDQKIIFRTNKIKKLTEELKILVKANKQLSDSVVDLSSQLNTASSVNEKVEDFNKQKVEDFNKQLAKIKKNHINEKNDLFQQIEKIIAENKLSKKQYETIANKNIQLANLKNFLERKIKEQADAIDELTLSNQELKDSIHHR